MDHLQGAGQGDSQAVHMVHGGRMRDSGHAWSQEVNFMRSFFIMSVTQCHTSCESHTNRLPREVLQFPSLKDWTGKDRGDLV